LLNRGGDLIQFLCDENISRKASKLLQKLGHDIETVQSLKLQGITNSNLLQKTIELDRILITFDTDFAQPPIKIFPGILLIRIQPNIDKLVLPALKKLLPKIETADFTNKVIILEEEDLHF
jgi:predicted nuclease of predicted toxin-antitoxin system